MLQTETLDYFLDQIQNGYGIQLIEAIKEYSQKNSNGLNDAIIKFNKIITVVQDITEKFPKAVTDTSKKDEFKNKLHELSKEKSENLNNALTCVAWLTANGLPSPADQELLARRYLGFNKKKDIPNSVQAALYNYKKAYKELQTYHILQNDSVDWMAHESRIRQIALEEARREVYFAIGENIQEQSPTTIAKNGLIFVTEKHLSEEGINQLLGPISTFCEIFSGKLDRNEANQKLRQIGYNELNGNNLNSRFLVDYDPRDGRKAVILQKNGKLVSEEELKQDIELFSDDPQLKAFVSSLGYQASTVHFLQDSNITVHLGGYDIASAIMLMDAFKIIINNQANSDQPHFTFELAINNREFKGKRIASGEEEAIPSFFPISEAPLICSKLRVHMRIEQTEEGKKFVLDREKTKIRKAIIPVRPKLTAKISPVSLKDDCISTTACCFFLKYDKAFVNFFASQDILEISRLKSLGLKHLIGRADLKSLTKEESIFVKQLSADIFSDKPISDKSVAEKIITFVKKKLTKIPDDPVTVWRYLQLAQVGEGVLSDLAKLGKVPHSHVNKASDVVSNLSKKCKNYVEKCFNDPQCIYKEGTLLTLLRDLHEQSLSNGEIKQVVDDWNKRFLSYLSEYIKNNKQRGPLSSILKELFVIINCPIPKTSTLDLTPAHYYREWTQKLINEWQRNLIEYFNTINSHETINTDNSKHLSMILEDLMAISNNKLIDVRTNPESIKECDIKDVLENFKIIKNITHLFSQRGLPLQLSTVTSIHTLHTNLFYLFDCKKLQCSQEIVSELRKELFTEEKETSHSKVHDSKELDIKVESEIAKQKISSWQHIELFNPWINCTAENIQSQLKGNNYVAHLSLLNDLLAMATESGKHPPELEQRAKFAQDAIDKFYTVLTGIDLLKSFSLDAPSFSEVSKEIFPVISDLIILANFQFKKATNLKQIVSTEQATNAFAIFMAAKKIFSSSKDSINLKELQELQKNLLQYADQVLSDELSTNEQRTLAGKIVVEQLDTITKEFNKPFSLDTFERALAILIAANKAQDKNLIDANDEKVKNVYNKLLDYSTKLKNKDYNFDLIDKILTYFIVRSKTKLSSEKSTNDDIERAKQAFTAGANFLVSLPGITSIHQEQLELVKQLIKKQEFTFLEEKISELLKSSIVKESAPLANIVFSWVYEISKARIDLENTAQNQQPENIRRVVKAYNDTVSFVKTTHFLMPDSCKSILLKVGDQLLKSQNVSSQIKWKVETGLVIAATKIPLVELLNLCIANNCDDRENQIRTYRILTQALNNSSRKKELIDLLKDVYGPNPKLEENKSRDEIIKRTLTLQWVPPTNSSLSDPHIRYLSLCYDGSKHPGTILVEKILDDTEIFNEIAGTSINIVSQHPLLAEKLANKIANELAKAARNIFQQLWDKLWKEKPKVTSFSSEEVKVLLLGQPDVARSFFSNETAITELKNKNASEFANVLKELILSDKQNCTNSNKLRNAILDNPSVSVHLLQISAIDWVTISNKYPIFTYRALSRVPNLSKIFDQNSTAYQAFTFLHEKIETKNDGLPPILRNPEQRTAEILLRWFMVYKMQLFPANQTYKLNALLNSAGSISEKELISIFQRGWTQNELDYDFWNTMATNSALQTFVSSKTQLLDAFKNYFTIRENKSKFTQLYSYVASINRTFANTLYVNVYNQEPLQVNSTSFFPSTESVTKFFARFLPITPASDNSSSIVNQQPP